MWNLLTEMQFKINFALLLALLLSTIQLNCVVQGCTDFQMNFTNFQLSARTMDLGMNKNWTISTWPRGEISKMPTYDDDTTKIQPFVWEASYGVLAVSANWLGDDRALLPFLYSDALNEAGISCGLQTLVGSKYETPKTRGINVFNGLFCKYVTQTYGSLDELYIALPHISIYGPDALDQHFILHDSLGLTMIIEMIDGEKVVYYEAGNYKGGKESSFATNTGYGICTNEPPLNWHYETVAHYEWKRSLARQAVAVPGGFYPEDRYTLYDI
jgi:penicillin V acylase-like amidase (Ntn superfamily)